jgi:hypothetical protein
MNSEQLIELTKELIYQATHFNVAYVEQIYADNLLIVKVDKAGKTETTNKAELVSFVTGNRDAATAPFSTKADFHHALIDGNMGMVVMTRDLELNGKSAPKFFTMVWENIQGKWQVVKESYLALD